MRPSGRSLEQVRALRAQVGREMTFLHYNPETNHWFERRLPLYEDEGLDAFELYLDTLFH